MKPTQEQVIAWAREAGYLEDMFGFGIWDSKEFNDFATLAYEAGYEAGRKDENEACAEMCEVKFDFCGDELLVADAIRARREQ